MRESGARYQILLADEFTVLTYDRRGNSRSPRPADWTSTSVDQQATDAAELLMSLNLAPALVYGSSSGAIFANHEGYSRGRRG